MNQQQGLVHALCASAAFLLVSIAPSAAAEGFVAGSVGQANWRDIGCDRTLTCDRHDTAGTLRAGYRYSPWLAVEACYFDLGRAHRTFSAGITDLTIEPPAALTETTSVDLLAAGLVFPFR